MATVVEVQALALQHHQAGNLAQAEQLYRQILQVDPTNAKAWHLLGVLALQAGRHDLAIGTIRQAIAFGPAEAAFYANLGLAYHAAGLLNEARVSLEQALRLRPDFAEAHNSLGVVARGMGRLDEAILCFQQATRFKPDYAEFHHNLGMAQHEQGRPDEAVASLRQALRLRPDSVEALCSLGAALVDLGQTDEALRSFQEVLRLQPGHVNALVHLGAVHQNLGRLAEALQCYDRALDLEPAHPIAHGNRAMVRLLLGDFERGWPEYEWRWKSSQLTPRSLPQPLWDGSALAGRTILLYTEQGLGDTLLFIRYATLLKRRGGTVVVECPGSLIPLLSSCPGVDRLIARGSALPAFDVQAPLLSLPALLGTSLATVPAEVPYLFADARLVERWRGVLGPPGTFKIGIAWQGKSGKVIRRRRSIPLRHFAPLARMEGVRLFSLQKGAGSEQLQEVGEQFPVTDLGKQLDEGVGAFMDTAAVMKNLDLVISSDTSIPNLAGALGVPVWLALWNPPEWRWLLGREDSPWYPTMRLFRQRQAGDWEDVFQRMADALRDLRAAKGE